MALALALDPLISDIWCTGCKRRVPARLTDGTEMYPNRPDLADLPFWKCDTCGAFVGTHHKTKNRYKALGFLATPEVKKWRMIIHSILDPLWKTGKIKRGKAYKYISHRLGRDFHTAQIYSVEEGMQVYEIIKGLKQQLDPGPWNR
jgi:hypothetical protein